jgi:hypothetical protein
MNFHDNWQHDHWILGDDGEPQSVDLLTWAHWFEAHPEARIVRRDTVAPEIEVSTVFLGLNHAFTGGPPVLWETMVFGGPLDCEMERYTSKEDAVAGHQAMCDRVAEALREAP